MTVHISDRIAQLIKESEEKEKNINRIKEIHKNKFVCSECGFVSKNKKEGRHFINEVDDEGNPIKFWSTMCKSCYLKFKNKIENFVSKKEKKVEHPYF